MTRDRGDMLHRMDDINHTNRLIDVICGFQEDLERARQQLDEKDALLAKKDAELNRLYKQLKLLRLGRAC